MAFTQDFDAWGNPTGHTGTPPAIGYKFQLTDPETGLIYLRARYYDPVTAQFLTPDPLLALTGERYGYAGNDPINSDDPMGLLCIVHNDNGGCKGAGTVRRVTHDVAAAPGHVAHDVNNDVVRAVGNTCVTIDNSNCDSYASSTSWGHDVMVGSSLVLGVDAIVLSGGAVVAPEIFGTEALLVGAAGTGIDGYQCFGAHESGACAGFWGSTRLSVVCGLGFCGWGRYPI